MRLTCALWSLQPACCASLLLLFCFLLQAAPAHLVAANLAQSHACFAYGYISTAINNMNNRLTSSL